MINTASSFGVEGSCFSSMVLISGLQLPQPIPAPDAWHKLSSVLAPSLIFSQMLPSPTPPQLHTSLPITAAAFLPERKSSSRFSDNSILLDIRSLNSRNSDLSP